VELHADHISPWADGGKTVLENLQTLCQNCNLGKGKSFGKVEISRSNQEVC
jgi:5-methylcytosine-specific restriction endonuclease McrA